MNEELIKSLEQETDEDLFYYFKHDGAIDFEKKMIAGKILYDRGYNKAKLVQEKALIVNPIKEQLKKSEDSNYLAKKNSKKMNLRILLGLLIIFLFSIKETVLPLFNDKPIDTVYLSIIISVGFVYIAYKILTYKKTLQDLINTDLENNDLLKFRLDLIEREWKF